MAHSVLHEADEQLYDVDSKEKYIQLWDSQILAQLPLLRRKHGNHSPLPPLARRRTPETE